MGNDDWVCSENFLTPVARFCYDIGRRIPSDPISEQRGSTNKRGKKRPRSYRTQNLEHPLKLPWYIQRMYNFIVQRTALGQGNVLIGLKWNLVLAIHPGYFASLIRTYQLVTNLLAANQIVILLSDLPSVFRGLHL